MIADNPAITVDQIAEKTGLTHDGVRYQIRSLKVKVGLRRVGGKNGGHWEFAAANAQEEGARK